MKMKPALKRLHVIAKAWQRHHCRMTSEAVDKIEDEIAEFREACTRAEALDELDDITVNILRALTTLNPDELEFMVRVMEMKRNRRTGPHGNKDKDAEAEHVAALIKEYL